MNYNDETACEDLIRKIKQHQEPLNDNDMRELCRFNTRSADSFWQEHMYYEEYIPYSMMSRTDHVSDVVSEDMNEFLDLVLEKTVADKDDSLDAYCLLNYCLFKKSPKLLRMYRRIGAEYQKISRLRIKWSFTGFELPDDFPAFLHDRLEAEERSHAENTFMRYLNDVLITTMFDEVMTNGFNSLYINDFEDLFTEYPEAFAPARFGLDFMKDNSRAYDETASLRNDISKYDDIMWVLDGLYSEDGVVYQGSPLMMTGPDNRIIHLEMRIKKLDMRWIAFLCGAPFYIILYSGISDPYYASYVSERFSGALYALASGNTGLAELLKGYFEDAAMLCGSPDDLFGARICGVVSDVDSLKAFYTKCAKLAIEGKRVFRPKLMKKVFTNEDAPSPFSAEDCDAALSDAEKLINVAIDNGTASETILKEYLNMVSVASDND